MTNSLNVGACAGDNRQQIPVRGNRGRSAVGTFAWWNTRGPRYTCRLPEGWVRAGAPPTNRPAGKRAAALQTLALDRRLGWRVDPYVGCLARAGGGAFLLGCSTTYEIAKLVAVGDVRALRERNDRGATDTERPSLLIIGIDGMKRDVLYDLLESGQLPGLELLLGGRTNGSFAHAHLDRSMLAPFPSVTLTGWASIFTGEPPGVSGIPGNEFFIREQRRFVAPIPCSFDDKAPVLETYTEDYANKLLEVPTVYERLRAGEPEIDVSVSASQFYRGADRLLIAQRSELIDMFYAKVKDLADGKAFAMFEERDRKVLDVVIDEIEDDGHPAPDVLTVYASGTDAYAHAAPEGPDRALRRFMTGKVDEKFAELAEALQKGAR